MLKFKKALILELVTYLQSIHQENVKQDWIMIEPHTANGCYSFTSLNFTSTTKTNLWMEDGLRS